MLQSTENQRRTFLKVKWSILSKSDVYSWGTKLGRIQIFLTGSRNKILGSLRELRRHRIDILRSSTIVPLLLPMELKTNDLGIGKILTPRHERKRHKIGIKSNQLVSRTCSSKPKMRPPSSTVYCSTSLS